MGSSCSAGAAELPGLLLSPSPAKIDALRHAGVLAVGAGASGAMLDAPIAGAIAAT